MKCPTCRFFVAREGAKTAEMPGLFGRQTINLNDGWCHRYPDTKTVYADHWCGEFQPEASPLQQTNEKDS